MLRKGEPEAKRKRDRKTEAIDSKYHSPRKDGHDSSAAQHIKRRECWKKVKQGGGCGCCASLYYLTLDLDVDMDVTLFH
jgi:hypothetical protein